MTNNVEDDSFPEEWTRYTRSSGIRPGDEVTLIRGSRGRGPDSGPGYERKVKARYVAGDAFNVVCELLEDDPDATTAPFRRGERGLWHGESFVRPLEDV